LRTHRLRRTSLPVVPVWFLSESCPHYLHSRMSPTFYRCWLPIFVFSFLLLFLTWNKQVLWRFRLVVSAINSTDGTPEAHRLTYNLRPAVYQNVRFLRLSQNSKVLNKRGTLPSAWPIYRPDFGLPEPTLPQNCEVVQFNVVCFPSTYETRYILMRDFSLKVAPSRSSVPRRTSRTGNQGDHGGAQACC
jgi:hypothetical protein